MRGDGGLDGEFVMRAFRQMGGRAEANAARTLSYRLMGKRANKWRGFDVILAQLVEQGTLRICPNGCYEIPPAPRRRDPGAVHRGTTFYSDPNLGHDHTLPPTQTDWNGARTVHLPQRGINE